MLENEGTSSSIEEATRNLISVLTAQITDTARAESQPQQQQSVSQPRQSTTVQQEMARSFPGYFSKAPKKGKKRFNSPHKVVSSCSGKTVALQFYLLKKNMDRTPKETEELVLLQAGMGRRTITLPEGAEHFEISRLLVDHYPKLAGLTGGWLLHKALGGSGQRKLVVVPPEAEGYTGQYLKTMSGGGKNIIYIVPLQEELDTSPLPLDAYEFQKMPKAACQLCGSCMPLQVLALHVKSCVGRPSSENDTENCGRSSPDVSFVAKWPSTEDTSSTSTGVNTPNTEAACPLCQIKYPLDYLEIHASSCGERVCPDNVMETSSRVEDVSKVITDGMECINDVLQNLTAQVDQSSTFNICVSRKNLLQRGIQQWQRQKKASPVNALQIRFIGEAGVDTGALRKEFLTEMVSGIEKRFFEGPKDGKGKIPKYSISDLDNDNFRTVGEILAVSLAQGGPAPTFFREWCYTFLATGDVDKMYISKEDVANNELSLLIAKVDAATEDTLLDLTEDIVACGYTGKITVQNQDRIVRSIVLHLTMRLLPVLHQIRSGLQLYSLHEIMGRHPDICRSLFIPGNASPPDADFIMSSCAVIYSEKGSASERAEVEIINFLQDFLQEIEESNREPADVDGEDIDGEDDGEDDGLDIKGRKKPLSVSWVLQWMTGQGHIPINPSERRDFKITLQFDHQCTERFGAHGVCYPIVSACSNTVTLPSAHLKTYEQFKRIMTEALLLGQGFHRL